MRPVASNRSPTIPFFVRFSGVAMSIRWRWILTVSLAAVSAGGCTVSKSSNPLSPSVAGPIAGVTIGSPAAMEPGQDWQIFMRDQPLKLLFQNSTSSGVRPLTYTVEISGDANFSSIVVQAHGHRSRLGNHDLVSVA